jgi:hypothetical protein
VAAIPGTNWPNPQKGCPAKTAIYIEKSIYLSKQGAS